MAGGQHRVDEVTRTESRRLDSKNKPRIAAHRPPKETADCAMQESVRKEQKKSQTLLTWPTSLEMLRTGIITTCLTVRRIPGLPVGKNERRRPEGRENFSGQKCRSQTDSSRTVLVKSKACLKSAADQTSAGSGNRRPCASQQAMRCRNRRFLHD